MTCCRLSVPWRLQLTKNTAALAVAASGSASQEVGGLRRSLEERTAVR